MHATDVPWNSAQISCSVQSPSDVISIKGISDVSLQKDQIRCVALRSQDSGNTGLRDKGIEKDIELR